MRRNEQTSYRYNSKENKTKMVPIVITFSRALRILWKHIQKLHTSDRMKQIFTEAPILAFKRDKTLQNILVHKKHNNLFFSKPNWCEPCGIYCAVCPYIMTSDKFEDHGGKQYNVKNYQFNCQFTNVVYAVFCKKCTKYVYVGEMGDTLYQRQLWNLSRKKLNMVIQWRYISTQTNTQYKISL